MQSLMEKIEHKVQEDDLLRKCRKREKVFKRMFIYNMMFNHDIQVTQIGRFFNRNHASIINALKVYENLKSTKDQELIAVLFEYMKYFEQYDIKKMQYSIRKDLRNATTFRDIGIMRKRLESNLYNDLKK
jgi:hypothetical protein